MDKPDRAYILFTRIPTAGKVKTRLTSRLSGEEAKDVQQKLLLDHFQKFSLLPEQGIAVFVAYSDEQDPTDFLTEIPESFQSFPQTGKTIGKRMENAIKEVFRKGYQQVILTGSDIPNLSDEMIQQAFSKIKDIVIGPSADGGYYLIGCRKGIELAPIFTSQISWGGGSVLDQTLLQLKNLDVTLVQTLQDIDEPSDLTDISGHLNKENTHFAKWLKANRGKFE